MTRLLLVEDEPGIFKPLRALLEREGYTVTHCATARRARALVQQEPAPELIILDWMLPDGQGIDLLRDWRLAHLPTPVLFLSARVELIDKVLALEMGADDYITKPFEPRELLARLKARLRRSQPAPPAAPTRLSCAGVELCPETRAVSHKGSPIDLTRMEFALLHLLMAHPGRVFSRDELLNQVWGYDAYPCTRTVDNHILQLRRKTRAELFESIRGVGYRLRAPDMHRSDEDLTHS